MSGLSPVERAAGLSQPLPPHERILWQAKPDARELTRTVFRLRAMWLYFAIAALLIAGLALRQGRPAGQAVAEATLLAPFALASWGLLTLLGHASARAATYTLTNRRVILHIGVAYEMTVSVPLSAITGAALRRGRRGTGEIALAVSDAGGTGYVALWPHARAWHWRRPQPSLRAVPDVAAACELIGDALVEFNAGGRMRRPQPAPAPVAVAAPEAVAA